MVSSEELENKIDYHFKNKNFLRLALTHSSYANEHHMKKTAYYERLEFLGDAVVDLVVADYLYANFKETEGEMTKVRASYVCENALYQYSTALGLTKYIKVGHGEMKASGTYKKAIVADIFEALIGAIYIDLGYATARRVALNIITPYINDNVTFFSDYKSALQEAVQTNKQSIEYVLIKESGPAHNKTFTFEVRIDNISYGVGTAKSKKEAEQIAAKDALDKLVI